MATPFDKIRYEAAQRARIGWFSGQKLLARRFTKPVKVPDRLRGRDMPGTDRLTADLRELLERDWRNIEAGVYAMPEDWQGGPVAELRRAVDFFADLGAVEARRHGDAKDRVFNGAPDGRYPRYYLQNFHFQSDGYLSEASAERYDHQVEVLFGGGAAAMRRQALVPLRAALLEAGGAAKARLHDIACGTGAFLREAKRNHPRLSVTGLDLSAPYLAVAGRRLADWSRVELIEGVGEAMPFEAAGFDIVSCIYLMHELPPRTRRQVAAEIARVLKPGGTLILVDSLQTGDVPEYDGLLDFFPVGFHEPYFASYLAEDLDAVMGPEFSRERSDLAYFSKVLTYRRTGPEKIGTICR
jgi:ubiquinone/menaquinone biosynthesis C-methylase UbiE